MYRVNKKTKKRQILNPQTGRFCNVTGTLGKQLVKKTKAQQSGGGGSPAKRRFSLLPKKSKKKPLMPNETARLERNKRQYTKQRQQRASASDDDELSDLDFSLFERMGVNKKKQQPSTPVQRHGNKSRSLNLHSPRRANAAVARRYNTMPHPFPLEKVMNMKK